MKKIILLTSGLLLVLSSLLQSRELSPSLSIRYEDFINNLTPNAAIGLRLEIDEDRYTGFEVNSDGSDTRLLMGWNWGLIGIGSLTNDAGTFPHYTFGVSYEILDGLNSNFEYVMTPDETAGVTDHLRLALSINF